MLAINYFEFLVDELLLQSGDNLKIPDSYLDTSVVREQLKIIRELRKPSIETWEKLKCGTSLSKEERKMSGFAEKLRQNAPYNVFFTVIPESSITEKQKNSLKITGALLFFVNHL